MNHDNYQVSRYDLVIERRHASWLVAGVIALLVFVFVVGYVSGKRAALRVSKQERIFS